LLGFRYYVTLGTSVADQLFLIPDPGDYYKRNGVQIRDPETMILIPGTKVLDPDGFSAQLALISSVVF
jgi:hypothetical protein